MDDETIVSLATHPGRAGVAVVRISGTNTKDIVYKIVKEKNFKIKPREVKYCYFTDGSEIIDDGLITYFQRPNSFTGEDVAELSIHSNPFIIEELINTVEKKVLFIYNHILGMIIILR